MATYKSDKAADGVQALSQVGVNTVVARASLTAAISSGDTVELVKIPSGATITDITIHSTDIDTDGSPAVTFDIGDRAGVDRYAADSTLGQAAGYVSYTDMLVGGFGYEYSSSDVLTLTATASAATGVAGTIVAIVSYVLTN